MPPLPRRKKPPVFRWAHILLLILGVTLLGYVGYTLLDAKIFQAYENWRFEQSLEKSRQALAIAKKQAPPDPGAPVTPVVEAPHEPIAPGTPLGRLEITRIGVAVIILEGTSGKALKRGVGHISGTALPGEQGNVGIAGHRDTYFRALSEVRHDDEVTLTTLAGTYRYHVDSMRVVEANDIAVLKDTGESILTLVTCYPFYYVGPAPKRFIVRAHRS